VNGGWKLVTFYKLKAENLIEQKFATKSKNYTEVNTMLLL
jgi:hypothetical protein